MLVKRAIIEMAKYTLSEDGVREPNFPTEHRNEEYPEEQFATLWEMQQRHFWYRGRRRFLLHVLDQYRPSARAPLAAIDLGGGVGGWVKYLANQRAGQYVPLALGDSSRTALSMASGLLPEYAERYKIDLMNLGWENHWDVAFLLDVIEHLPNDLEALRQARAALKPGGLLFVTTPAFQKFWSYNDELACHLRRYTKNDFARLAEKSGMQLCEVSYFMFLLSPLYIISRHRYGIKKLSPDGKRRLRQKAHKVPAAPLNFLLTLTFSLETPLSRLMNFPWGTSILGVFRK